MIPLALTATLVLATASIEPVSTAPLIAQLDMDARGPSKTRVIYAAEPEQDRSHRWLFLAGGVLVLVGLYLALKSKPDGSLSRAAESENDDEQ